MRNVLQVAAVVVLVACGGDATGGGGQEGVLDAMRQTSGQLTFHVGDSYVFAEQWEASDGIGRTLPLDSIEAHALGILYSLGDSLPSSAGAVDRTGAFTLQAPFIGFLYVFGPTLRDTRERLGQHYIDVEP